jgi:hypothetical protein
MHSCSSFVIASPFSCFYLLKNNSDSNARVTRCLFLSRSYTSPSAPANSKAVSRFAGSGWKQETVAAYKVINSGFEEFLYCSGIFGQRPIRFLSATSSTLSLPSGSL